MNLLPPRPGSAKRGSGGGVFAFLISIVNRIDFHPACRFIAAGRFRLNDLPENVDSATHHNVVARLKLTSLPISRVEVGHADNSARDTQHVIRAVMMRGRPAKSLRTVTSV